MNSVSRTLGTAVEAVPAARLGDDAVVFGGRIALALLLLLGWEWAARRLGLLYLAGPLDVAVRSWELVRSGELLRHTAATLAATFLGFGIGWVAGTLLPFVLLRSPRVTAAVEPWIIASMGIPKFALTPLLILWFGIGLTPKVVVVAFMVFYMIFLNTFAGLRSVDPRLTRMAQVVGASRWQLARRVLWPSMQPFVLSGLKISLPRALSAAIVGEFLVADQGLGHYIEHARQAGDTVGVFTGIALVTLLVMGLNAMLVAWEGHVLAWRAMRETAL